MWGCVAPAVFGDFQGAFLQPHPEAARAFAWLSKGSAEEAAAPVSVQDSRRGCLALEAAVSERNKGSKVINTYCSYQISTDLGK